MNRIDRLSELLDEVAHGPKTIIFGFVKAFPGLLALYDGKNNGLVFSEDFCHLLKRREEELIGHAWVDLCHPEDLVETAELARSVKLQDDRVTIYNRWLTGDGDFIHLKWITAPWKSVGDGREYSICFATAKGVHHE
jgi:PAS domain S-box-containing protein